jgi:predicted DNA binding CopG/RHH family protein
MMKKKIVNVRMDEKDLQALKKKAKELRVSVSDYIRIRTLTEAVNHDKHNY